MGLFSKRDSTYDVYGDDGEKRPNLLDALRNICHILCLCFWNIVTFIGFTNKRAPGTTHYDRNDDGISEITPLAKSLAICNIIFISYGIIAGIFVQHYCEMLCFNFAVTALGEKAALMGASSPVCMMMNIGFVLFCYFGACAILGFIYFVCPFILFRNEQKDKYQEKLQMAYAYGVLCLVLVGILCFILPWNFLI